MADGGQVHSGLAPAINFGPKAFGPTAFLDGRVVLYQGDCLDVLASLPENSVDGVCTDPPYHLTSIIKRFGKAGSAPAKVGKTGAFARSSKGFMGKQWDGGDVAFRVATWKAVLRVLKPGGYIIAFASTRGFGRMSVAIEDAGFITHPLLDYLFDHTPDIDRFLFSLSPAQLEMFARLIDQSDGGMLAWIFGSGFPKATKIKACALDGPLAGIDVEGMRYGGQSLKPAIEPIYMGQKPFEADLSGTENILKWGTGAVNIDACRIASEPIRTTRNTALGIMNDDGWEPKSAVFESHEKGRWPANLIHDGSDEVLAGFPDTESVGHHPATRGAGGIGNNGHRGQTDLDERHGDSGSAARFFYSAKADQDDRLGSEHPTIKPGDLIQYLCRLITPPGGTVLDLFAGTGTTGEAAYREGRSAILIDNDPLSCGDIARRMALVLEPTRRSAVARSKNKLRGAEGTPLFGGEP